MQHSSFSCCLYTRWISLFCSSSLEEKVLKYENGSNPAFLLVNQPTFPFVIFCQRIFVTIHKLKTTHANKSFFFFSKWKPFEKKKKLLFFRFDLYPCIAMKLQFWMFLWFRRIKLDWTVKRVLDARASELQYMEGFSSPLGLVTLSKFLLMMS